VVVLGCFVVEVNVTEIVVLVWLCSKKVVMSGASVGEIEHVLPTTAIVICPVLRPRLHSLHLPASLG
jgi:hypothetical protein